MSEADVTYVPNPVPDDPAALIQFLSDELYRISAAIPPTEGLIRGGMLYGSVPPFALNTTPAPLANYSNDQGTGDALTGEIVVPVSGLYVFRAWVSGAMTSPNNNNQYWLNGLLNGAPILLAVNDVAHNSTDNIALSAVGTRRFEAGDVLQMSMQASASMGTCTLDNTTLEVVQT